jgi:chromosomal replication initiation ATPase DnaA
MKDNLEAKFYNEVLAATKLENREIEKISFKIDNNIDNPSNTDVIDCATFLKEVSKSKKSKKNIEFNNPIDHKVVSSRTATERYNLKNFVVGTDNQLAFSACEAVCRNPGKAYNPLYIYGDV